ncbi:MAG: hypothetical protein ABI678_03450, partial [Kofleriaceae bacterium]
APGKALEALADISEVAEAVNIAGEVGEESALFDATTLEADIDAAFDTGRVRSGTMVEFNDRGGALSGSGPKTGPNIWYSDNVKIPNAVPGGPTIELRTHAANPTAPLGTYSRSHYTTQINTTNGLYRLPNGHWKTLYRMTEEEIAAAHYYAGD